MATETTKRGMTGYRTGGRIAAKERDLLPRRLLYDGGLTQAGTVVALRETLADPQDADTRQGLREVLLRAVEAGERHLVLDLTGVTSVGSVVLGQFVDLLRRMRGEGGTVWVAGACPPVRRALAITCLSRVFGMAETVPEALAELGLRP